MINLPTTTRQRAFFRISVMPGNTPWSAQVWTPLDVPLLLLRDGTDDPIPGTVAQGGYHVSKITLGCLPDEDRAEFYIDYGTINGFPVSALDLSNYYVKIQVYDNENFPTSSTTNLPTSGYRTVFVGNVFYRSDNIKPSTSHVSNARATYYCVGALSRCRYWPMNKHAIIDSGVAKVVSGHPGYNFPLNGYFRRTIGNRDATLAIANPFGDDASGKWYGHAVPLSSSDNVFNGTTVAWTDEAAIQHALSSSRSTGEPVWTTDLGATLFQQAFPWPVNPGDSCLDFLRRICNRQRGRGCVYAKYSDDGTPTGTVSLSLVGKPSFGGNITYKAKADGQSPDLSITKTITGQTVNGAGDYSSIVDLVNDHRIYGPVQWENRSSSVYDWVELVGEGIQTIVPLNMFTSSSSPSLVKGWSTSDETAFNAANFYQRRSSRFRHVFRRFFLPTSWNWKTRVDAQSPGTNYPADYDFNIWCNDVGTITVTDTEAINGNSQVASRILADLPIYEGWRYDGDKPTRWDSANDYLPPPRMPPILAYKTDTVSGQPSSDHGWVNLLSNGWSIQVDDFGVLVTYYTEDSYGTRTLATNTLSPNGYQPVSIPGVQAPLGMDFGRMMLLCGVELSNRVRFAGGSAGSLKVAKRRMYMPVSGAHLWVGRKDVMWELDPVSAAFNNYPRGLRFPSSREFTLIRDDREQLAFMHALALKYYGEVHNPATWSLKDCGLLGGFLTQDGSAAYPRIGQIIAKIQVSPTEIIDVNTPVTSVHYDHDAGVTTWRTDFVNYEAGIQ